MDLDQLKKNYRIVLTGGPGAGKTTAADLLQREMDHKIAIVPESATMIFSGGFPRKTNESCLVATQKTIYHVQKNMENVISATYPERVLLCDR
ncbi:MAG: AAA family ATPase, partial [Bdellovibrionaceae bacterium]|nr:AAA family ATPase [Pseudobdellovibrionaceae bacterium]